MRSLTRAAFVGILVFVTSANGDAPTDQYSPFDSQVSDIKDDFTHLIWTRAFSSALAQSDALGTCDALAVPPQRLPTVRELLTLVDENPHYDWDPEAGAPTARYIDPNAFPGTPAGVFWSASFATGQNNTKLMGVDFGTGETVSNATLGFVRCVTDY